MKASGTIFITGIIALAVGVAVGVGAAEHKAESPGTAKSAGDSANGPSSTTVQKPGVTGNAWDPFQQISGMQLQIDKMFNQMSAQLLQEPQFSGFAENPSYSLSLNMRDYKDHYQVTAFLPNAKASDVQVKLNHQTLTVGVSNQQTAASNQKNGTTGVAEWGQYEQMIQLPSPVKADQMKIERHEHELIITVPKA